MASLRLSLCMKRQIAQLLKRLKSKIWRKKTCCIKTAWWCSAFLYNNDWLQVLQWKTDATKCKQIFSLGHKIVILAHPQTGLQNFVIFFIMNTQKVLVKLLFLDYPAHGPHSLLVYPKMSVDQVRKFVWRCSAGSLVSVVQRFWRKYKFNVLHKIR